MKKTLLLLLLAGWAVQPLCASKTKPAPATAPHPAPAGFITIDGVDLRAPDGSKFFIRGTNLGHWLNPEGYMFRFKDANSPHMIDEALREMVGPDAAAQFWRDFKDAFITRKDIAFIASTGANTIRVPFNYKLFTDEDYLGLTVAQDGFARIDTLVSWCRAEGLHIILDMHDAPGGNSGGNIDDSYGYPWLFVSEHSQQMFRDIWRRIAAHYKNEPVVLGYDLLNEPIGHQFPELNARYLDVCKMGIAAIREVDPNHIIILGGTQWNTNFSVFEGWKPDPGIMFSCHLYKGQALISRLEPYIKFRDSVNRPMYMGEIGHNTNEWMTRFREMMEENNIGWTTWPYKYIGEQTFLTIARPADWDAVAKFVESPRNSYDNIRAARPDQAVAQRALNEYIENCRFENCTPNEGFIEALGLKVK